MQYQLIYALLDSYKNALSPVFAINSGSTQYDLASQQDTAGLMFSMMLPMLITVFLFSGCMAVAPESIAGEKERGTIATMLVTPLARWELALGKIVALACIALLSGLSSFIGVMLSIPKLFQTLPEESVAILYGFSDYAMLLGVILSTVMIYIGLISILSALAKTIKEANTYVMPLMIVILMVGALGMFSQGASKEALTYLIPVYNSVQCMVGIFSFAINPLFIFVTIATNSLVTATCVIILTKMFNSERIVFNR
jgi:sodium transport system permease protein